jgi:lysine 2,3-aminomutase
VKKFVALLEFIAFIALKTSQKRHTDVARPLKCARFWGKQKEMKNLAEEDFLRGPSLKRPQKETWKEILSGSLTTVRELSEHFEIADAGLENVLSRYPMRINPYYLGLIKKKGDHLYKQAVPDLHEITDPRGDEDPLDEEVRSPVPGLTHKYPDRVLFLVSGECALYCRFCNRKRKVGRPQAVTAETIREGISYIKGSPKVRDVLLSGGDPLLLPDKMLYGILNELRSVSHVEIIRIGTRVPCTLPQRVTPELAAMLRGFHPLYISTHFNHPDEVTPEAGFACAMLAEAGIPLGCQTVLLKGVNDNAATMHLLIRKLIANRIRPYYLFQTDLARGTSHFWTPVRQGIEIMEKLRVQTSSFCLPHFVIDLLGGGGKVPV